jgi:tetratricopeptide (TPR) repeat protein
VIAHLSKIGTLEVISRTSVMRFKDRQQSLRAIAEELQVSTILEGSVRRAGDRIRVVAQLIDAATDQHLWAETYDRQLTDIFAIQTDVALHIAAALHAELSPDQRSRVAREPTRDVQAYQLYLQGRHCFIRFTTEGMRQSIGYFEQAAARDPRFAGAYAGIAMAYVELFETGAMSAEETYPPAKQAVERALELDPEQPDAHCVLAFAKLVFDFDWEGSEAEFQRTLELSPNHADAWDLYGRLCSALERHEEGIAMARRAQELDPLAHRLDVATALLRAGRAAEALEVATQAITFQPDYARGHATRGWVLIKLGRQAEGLAALERAVALSPGDPLWLAQLGQAYAEAGQTERARGLLQDLEEQARTRYVAPYHLAYLYTGLGQWDRAMECLETAYQQRAGSVYGIKGSFLLAPLRSHPRFQALLRKMRLA